MARKPAFCPLDYASARGVLRGRNSRVIYNNTTLTHVGWYIDLSLHGRRIIELFPDGAVRLYDGGYRSVTTKGRLNWIRGVSVTQKDFSWYANDMTFFNGIVIIPRHPGFPSDLASFNAALCQRPDTGPIFADYLDDCGYPSIARELRGTYATVS